MIEIGFQSGAKQQHGDRFPHWVMSAGAGAGSKSMVEVMSC